MPDPGYRSSLRASVLEIYRNVLRRRCRRRVPSEIERSALVVSPHFDDETLGCGGTIHQKKRSGAEVTLVFMTDGSRSHQHLMAPGELSRIRSQEGRDAARILGLDGSDVLLLGFEETQLHDRERDATARMLAILRERQPEQVFMPSAREPLLWSGDHRATTRIVKAALSQWRSPHPVTVYEYPIWFYRHWPWTKWSVSRPEQKTFLRLGLESPFGLGVLWTFRCCHDIGDALDRKRAALAAHRSQMEPLLPCPDWPTLEGVADGTFLSGFLLDFEIFHRYVVETPGGDRLPPSGLQKAPASGSPDRRPEGGGAQSPEGPKGRGTPETRGPRGGGRERASDLAGPKGPGARAERQTGVDG